MTPINSGSFFEYLKSNFILFYFLFSAFVSCRKYKKLVNNAITTSYKKVTQENKVARKQKTI